MKFSANLGFLWNDRSLPDAIRAAKVAGFDAVECHWPFDVPAAEVFAALEETGLTMLGLNTRLLPGDDGFQVLQYVGQYAVGVAVYKGPGFGGHP